MRASCCPGRPDRRRGLADPAAQSPRGRRCGHAEYIAASRRGQPAEHVAQVAGARPAGPDAEMNPPYFFMVPATSAVQAGLGEPRNAARSATAESRPSGQSRQHLGGTPGERLRMMIILPARTNPYRQGINSAAQSLRNHGDIRHRYLMTSASTGHVGPYFTLITEPSPEPEAPQLCAFRATSGTVGPLPGLSRHYQGGLRCP
jgi:hypothetical protein